MHRSFSSPAAAVQVDERDNKMSRSNSGDVITSNVSLFYEMMKGENGRKEPIECPVWINMQTAEVLEVRWE